MHELEAEGEPADWISVECHDTFRLTVDGVISQDGRCTPVGARVNSGRWQEGEG